MKNNPTAPSGHVGSSDLLGEKRYAAVKRRIERERDEYQSTRLLSEQALDLCHAIERGVACEQLTKCSVLAAQLRQELERYEDTRPMTKWENERIAVAWKSHNETPFSAIEEAQATHRPASPNMLLGRSNDDKKGE